MPAHLHSVCERKPTLLVKPGWSIVPLSLFLKKQPQATSDLLAR